LARVVQEMDSRGFTPSGINDLAEAIHAPPQAIRAILAVGNSQGQIVFLSRDLFYSRCQLENVTSHLVKTGSREGFDPPTFREEVGLSRRLADALFQYLDQKGYVVRQDSRWTFLEIPQDVDDGKDIFSSGKN
jgi:hypothetical protein